MAHFCAPLTRDKWPAQDGSGKGQSQEKLTCEKKREPHQFLYFSFDAFLPKPPCSRKDLGWFVRKRLICIKYFKQFCLLS